jgi:hypothetical protein
MQAEPAQGVPAQGVPVQAVLGLAVLGLAVREARGRVGAVRYRGQSPPPCGLPWFSELAVACS